jgi:thiol-disulfide isomerase/thioredoxin
MKSSSKGVTFALVIGTAVVALGLIIAFPVRPFSQDSDMIKHPLVAAARKEPMMTMGPSGQDPALSAPLASVLTAQKWLNTEPLRPENLRGKVVLVNFWTFTCVNWLRTLPYIRAWAEKYKDRGLVVIGVHTPEFNVEKDFANVTRVRPRSASAIRSRSTTTTPSGERSITTRGRRSILSTPMGACAIRFWAKATTSNPSGGSRNCCPRPVAHR